MKNKVFQLLLISLLTGLAAMAQQPKPAENSRRFWPPEFRPQAATPNAKPRTGRYKPIATNRPLKILDEPNAQPATLGVTLWLMRTPEEIKTTSRGLGASADSARVLIKKKVGKAERNEEMIPQRIEANTPLKAGQLVRLTVEVPQDGFLYVIDREKYADGKLSAPFLIYPSDPQGMTHAVKAGRTIELPDSEWVFEVKAHSEENNALLAGEWLSFIITPHPLEGLPRANADGSLLQLTNAQVE